MCPRWGSQCGGAKVRGDHFSKYGLHPPPRGQAEHPHPAQTSFAVVRGKSAGSDWCLFKLPGPSSYIQSWPLFRAARLKRHHPFTSYLYLIVTLWHLHPLPR